MFVLVNRNLILLGQSCRQLKIEQTMKLTQAYLKICWFFNAVKIKNSTKYDTWFIKTTDYAHEKSSNNTPSSDIIKVISCKIQWVKTGTHEVKKNTPPKLFHLTPSLLMQTDYQLCFLYSNFKVCIIQIHQSQLCLIHIHQWVLTLTDEYAPPIFSSNDLNVVEFLEHRMTVNSALRSMSVTPAYKVY